MGFLLYPVNSSTLKVLDIVELCTLVVISYLGEVRSYRVNPSINGCLLLAFVVKVLCRGRGDVVSEHLVSGW